MLVHHARQSSIYFDLLAFSLSTADPFVHPVTCLLVSQRYRAGYKAALTEMLSILGKWTCGCKRNSRVLAHPVRSIGSGVSQTDNQNRNLATWKNSPKINGKNTNTDSTARQTFLKLEVIVEAVETQD